MCVYGYACTCMLQFLVNKDLRVSCTFRRTRGNYKTIKELNDQKMAVEAAVNLAIISPKRAASALPGCLQGAVQNAVRWYYTAEG